MNSLIKAKKLEIMLSPRQEKALENLPDTEKKLIEAALYPAVHKVAEQVCINTLGEIMTNVHLIAGQEIEQPKMIVFVHLFYRRLMQEFPMVTLEEVRQAMENGVYGQYGQFFGLNAKEFIRFVRTYISDVNRKAAIENYEKLKKQKDPVDPLPEYWKSEYWTDEHLEEWKAEAEKYFQYHLCDNKFVHAMPEGVYWVLRRLRKIEINYESWSELFLKAVSDYKAELLNTTRAEKERLLKELEMGMSSHTRAKINLQAKQKAVFNFFVSIRDQHDNILW